MLARWDPHIGPKLGHYQNAADGPVQTKVGSTPNTTQRLTPNNWESDSSTLVKAKTITKAGTYRAGKQRVGLSELWLVIHYSSPGVFNGPLLELGMEVGYGAHRKASQDSVASMAKSLLHKLGGGGPFDHMFLMIDCQPDPYVSEL
jgi:hypothetical protein